MKIIGIICEYNPFHLGHKKQIDQIRDTYGEEARIVCLMSGNFVQRGHPAIIDKSIRAQAALNCGADLVLELPVTAALASAEGFAAGGVRILSPFCDYLCFGAENADTEKLMQLAQALLSPQFPEALRTELDTGKSFPAARACALEAMGFDPSVLNLPNNILAVEYCKAILAQKSTMQPMPIFRGGSYHDSFADDENPSATALRELMLRQSIWKHFVPDEAADCFLNAPLHALYAGERAILSRLRTMSDGEFEAIPYGSEGLWRKLMKASRSCATLEQIIDATKSKRYTRSRIDRMILCAFLGITASDLETQAPYARVLALNDRGREVLKLARQTGCFPNAGQQMDDPYQVLENRCGALYGLFSLSSPEGPDLEANRRIIYKSEGKPCDFFPG